MTKIKGILSVLSLLLAVSTSIAAVGSDEQALTKKENLRTPVVADRQKAVVADYMRREAQALIKMGYTVETERKGEVIVITIPAKELFAPNETTLLPGGKARLEPLLSYLKAEDRFKMLVAMHSDDTGSAVYKEKLTEERLDAVVSYMADLANYPDQIVGYALADDEPLVPNNTIENRDRNRRLEIYIVPSNGLILNLKKK